MSRLALLAPVAFALTLFAFAPQPAFATFHEMMIREVYPGSLAAPDSEYVELQMWSPGQNLVGGHTITVFNATGSPTGSATFNGNVSGGANQSTLVAATPAAESGFGIAADAALPTDSIAPGGGAVCWESLDCISWGNFSGSVGSATGSPSDPGGIPDGMALRRTIARGCPTLLELADDTDSSAADFADAFPSPRPNSVAPAEHSCGGSSPGGNTAPQTGLRRKPPKKTRDRTPTFRFSSSETGSSFECKLDRKPFLVCAASYTTPRLSLGRHTLRVRARDRSGNVDPSPALYAFKVLRKRR
jgi:hypothetical protein